LPPALLGLSTLSNHDASGATESTTRSVRTAIRAGFRRVEVAADASPSSARAVGAALRAAFHGQDKLARADVHVGAQL
jgi:diketogulonate reductase-like aldo/keto reductase